MKPQLTTIFCLLLLFCIFEEAKAYDPPLVVYPLSIKFNYTSGYSNDALYIKKNNSTSIPVPEWDNGGSTNAPMAYIKNQSNRKIQVRFYCNYSFEKTVSGFIYSPSQEPIGILGYQEFLTYSGYTSPYVTVTTQGSIPQNVGIRNFMWHWQLYVKGISTITYTNHTYYTLLAAPQNPMSEPWTELLDYSCDWASGNSSTSSALYDLTEELYDCGVKYDGGTHYTVSSYTNLNLTLLLNHLSNPSIREMDCRDFSNFLQVLLNSLGGNCQYNRIGYSFYYNYLLPAGRSSVFNGYWNYHQVGWYNSKVADAATKIDNDSNPRSSPHSWKLAKGDMTLSAFIDKLTDYNISSVATGTCTVY